MTAKRRGVSPVIATLLIVIAVAAAVLTYIWVTGYMGKVTGAVEQTSTQQLQEKIKINAVSVNSTTKTVKLSVSNIGDTDVTISGAYVLTQGGTSVCSSSSSVSILKGGIQDVTISSCSLTSGTTYIAKAVTSKGTEATYTFTAP
jgi:archaellum component FlaF (FlaF/FlaG flagellin family)